MQTLREESFSFLEGMWLMRQNRPLLLKLAHFELIAALILPPGTLCTLQSDCPVQDQYRNLNNKTPCIVYLHDTQFVHPSRTTAKDIQRALGHFQNKNEGCHLASIPPFTEGNLQGAYLSFLFSTTSKTWSKIKVVVQKLNFFTSRTETLVYFILRWWYMRSFK